MAKWEHDAAPLKGAPVVVQTECVPHFVHVGPGLGIRVGTRIGDGEELARKPRGNPGTVGATITLSEDAVAEGQVARTQNVRRVRGTGCARA